jgi:PAS domain S-box-containing protein
VGLAGTVTSWNAAAAGAFGFRAEECHAAAPRIFAGSARARFFTALARALAGQQEEEIELACTPREGPTFAARFAAAPLREGGEARGAVFVEVGRGERGGSRSDRELQAVLDAIPAPIWFKDAGGIYRGCNAAFEEYVGLSRDTIVGRTVFDVAPPDLAEVYRKADLVLFRARATQTYEAKVQWADGTRREVVFRKASIVDRAGHVTGLAGTMLDVTDLRAAERELRTRLAQQAALTRLAARALVEEQPLQLLQAAVPLAVAAQGADGGGVLELAAVGGARTVRLLAAVGFPPGAGAADVPLEQDPVASRVVAQWHPLVVGDAAPDGFPLPPALQELGVRSLAAVPVGSADAPLGVLVVHRRAPRPFSGDDVQALEATAHVLAIALGRGRALEAARSAHEQLARAERLAVIGALAAGVAHELANPLAFILGSLGFATERLRAPGRDADVQEVLRALDDASEGAERMRAIVRDLRTVGSADTATPEPVEVRRVAEYVTRLARSEVRRRARLTWDLGDAPPVRGSEGRLGQVLLNLVVNAAQAIPEGAPAEHEIRVSARREGDGKVALAVADTGVGIPAEIRERIFDPFFTTKPAGVGTGLGLWICHKIVTEMGGSISVESGAGRGTTFRMVLPAAGGGASPERSAGPLAAAPRLPERP